MSADGRFSSVDLAAAETVFEPAGEGEGYWVGAPSVVRHCGSTYLAARWRTPDRRGHAVAIYERVGDDYEERTRISAASLGVESVERAALLSDPGTGDLKLYLPVDRGENDWCILTFDDAAEPSSFAPGTARPALRPAPGAVDDVTVKDPVVLTSDSRYYMYYAGHDGTSEQAHLATSPDGETWSRVDGNPVLARGGWHDHHTRVSCVFRSPSDDEWLVCYDGSARADYGATWNLRTGLAVTPDLEQVVDVTPDGPLLGAPEVGSDIELETFGTCRYVDVLPAGDGIEIFAEVARPDGSFALVRTDVHWDRCD